MVEEAEDAEPIRGEGGCLKPASLASLVGWGWGDVQSQQGRILRGLERFESSEGCHWPRAVCVCVCVWSVTGRPIASRNWVHLSEEKLHDGWLNTGPCSEFCFGV